jgi:hypothetical protein
MDDSIRNFWSCDNIKLSIIGVYVSKSTGTVLQVHNRGSRLLDAKTILKVYWANSIIKMFYLVGSSLILRLPVDDDTLNPRWRQALLLLLHLLQQNLQFGLRQALEPFLETNSV